MENQNQLGNNQQVNDWLEGQYLKASQVADEDIIDIAEEIGLVENTFGKKKFEFKVLWNGKEKILSASAKQYQQLKSVPDCKKFRIKRKPFGNSFVMDFEAIVPEKP